MKLDIKKYLGIIVSILILGIVIALLYTSYTDAKEEIARLSEECAGIEKEIAELDEQISEVEALRIERREIEEKSAYVLEHYALRNTPETAIRMVRGLEEATGTKVRTLSFGGESNFFSSELQFVEGAGPLQGYSTQLVLSYETSYGNFKRLLDYIKDYPERMNIDSVTASFNQGTGYLSGTMTLNLYRLTGTGRAYAAPMEPEVPIGVDNIFSTIR